MANMNMNQNQEETRASRFFEDDPRAVQIIKPAKKETGKCQNTSTNTRVDSRKGRSGGCLTKNRESKK